jgi:eukaryotic-like serine/threonine-protein kinase
MPLAPGTRIGSYEVIAAIGAGAMGEVYRARDLTLKREVALKVLPTALAGDGDRLTRFQREAEVLASLNHPNIAHIYGVVDRAIVMELVDGEDLAQRVARAPLAIGEAVPIARAIVEALDAAHAAGVIHRDLKPANIRLRTDGTVKVVDFGLAKPRPAESPLEASATVTAADVTLQGVIVGTAAYMAPEQAIGRSVDRRVDIWAFGCVLFEMLTGTRAFAKPTLSETLAAVLKDPAPLHLLPANTPAAIARLLERCFEKDPARRLRDIADARFDLELALSDGGQMAGTQVGPADASWIHRLRWVGAAAALAAVAVVPFIWGTGGSVGAPVLRLSLTTATDVPLQTDTPISALTMWPDGRRVIYQSRRTDPEGTRVNASQLVTRAFDSFDGTAMGDAGPFPVSAFVSPDGAWIGFETRTGPRLTPVLAKLPAAGGSMTTICELSAFGRLQGASWDGDGRIVFATDQPATGLLQVAAAGGTPASLTAPRHDQGERDHVRPEVLPDGAGVLFTVARTDGGFDVAVLPARSTTWRTLVRGGSAARYLTSGHLVYASGATLNAVGFDLRTLEVTTQQIPMVDKVQVSGAGAAHFAVSSTALAYVPARERNGASRAVWLNRDGSSAVLPLDPGDYQGAALSPDGKRIAMLVQESGVVSIWMYDMSLQSFTRVSPRGETVHGASWSRDSGRLAFGSEKQKGLFVMTPGSESAVRLTQFAAGAHIPYGWTHDDSAVAFVQQGGNDINLFAVSTAPPYTVRPLARSDAANVEAAFSPDGKWVAHVAYDGVAPEVVVGPAASPHRRWPVAPGGREPTWSARGREVLFLRDNAIHRVAIDPVSGVPVGTPTAVVKIPPGFNPSGINVTADGGRFLMLERVGTAGRSEIRVVLNWEEELRTKMQQAKPLSR